VRGGRLRHVAEASAVGISRRHLSQRATLVCILVRHLTNLVVAGVSVLDPDMTRQQSGRILLVLLVCWTVYRLITRSALWQFTAADLCWTVAVAVSLPKLVSADGLLSSTTPPQVIVSAAVATFAVQVRPRFSVFMGAVVAAAYLWGSIRVVGWPAAVQANDLYRMVAGWGAATLLRMLIWRIADAVDEARFERKTAEIARSVATARRNYDREQLALLHDTAAATLLMIGQSAPVSRERMAAQARRDLELLAAQPWKPPDVTVNIADALRAETAHLNTEIRITGQTVWLRGHLAAAVMAAAREIVNNIDRHAQATSIHIDVQPDQVTISDDGVGFDPGIAPLGHGIRASVVARMHRAGGTGSVRSAPAKGTVAVLSWPDPRALTLPVEAAPDTDRLIGRIRSTYALTLMGFAVTALVTAFPPLSAFSRYVPAQIVMAAFTGVCALAAVPAVVLREWRPAWVAAVALAAISLLQPILLSANELPLVANWSPSVVGFCLVPLLLRWPTGRAAITLCGFWIVPSVLNLCRDFSRPMLLFVGLSVAATLIPQLFAVTVSSWAFSAAESARRENDAHFELVTAEKIAEAIQADYLKRYADLMTNVTALLRTVSETGPITPELRRQARAESRELRARFDQLRADHPLLFEIRALIDETEERGVEVSMFFDGEVPPLEPDRVDRIVTTVGGLLALAVSAARVVITVTGDELAISVVCEAAGADIGGRPEVDDDVEVVWVGATAWMEAHYPLS
jgi:hypothetical protein